MIEAKWQGEVLQLLDGSTKPAVEGARSAAATKVGVRSQIASMQDDINGRRTEQEVPTDGSQGDPVSGKPSKQVRFAFASGDFGTSEACKEMRLVQSLDGQVNSPHP